MHRVLLQELQALLQGRDVEWGSRSKARRCRRIVGAKPAITGDLDGGQFSLNDLHGDHAVTHRLVGITAPELI